MKILCLVFGHKYKVLKKFNYTSRCVTCKRCNRIWAMNDNTKCFLEWDSEFTELYDWSPYIGELKEGKCKQNG